MAKAESKVPAKWTTQQAHEALNELALTGSDKTQLGITREEAIEILLNASPNQLTDLTGEIFKVTDGDINNVYHFVVEAIDIATFNEKDGSKKEVEVVRLTSVKEDKAYMATHTVIVGACKKLTQLPAYVRIQYLGKKGSGTNKYDAFTVMSL